MVWTIEEIEKGWLAGSRVAVSPEPRPRVLGNSGSFAVEKHEARAGDVVEDRDRALDRHHPVVPPADQQDARPDAGEVRRAHAGFMPGCALSSR